MKIISLILLLLFFTANLKAQSLDCAKFKNGKFTSTYNGRTTIIERSGSYQTEYVVILKDTIKMSFKVNWPGDCTYTLTPTEETFQKYAKLPKNALITVQISNTTANSYTQNSTSNFVNKTIVSEVLKIK